MSRAFIVASLLLLGTSASAAGPGRPLLTTRLQIEQVSQDGNRIAWMSGACDSVRLRILPLRRSVLLGNTQAADCSPQLPLELALAGGRALWVGTEAGNEVYSELVTATAHDPGHFLEEVVGSAAGSDGDYVTDLAGDGTTLVYSVITMSFLDTCIEPGQPCEFFVDGGRIMRLVGHAARKIPRMPPALALAASNGRVAMIVAAHDAPGGNAVPNGTVEVRDAITGSLVTSVAVGGEPLGLALGTSVLAVAVRSSTGITSLLRYRAGTGEPLGRSTLRGAPADLGVAGRRVLFRIGRAIKVLDAVSGATRGIAVAASRPVGLSIEGRRVVWAEQSRGRTRIVEVVAR